MASFKLTRLMALLFFAVTLMARECVIEVSCGLLGIGGRIGQGLGRATARVTTSKGGETVNIRHIL